MDYEEFKEQARNRHEALEQVMATAPPPDLVLAAVAGSDPTARRRIEPWSIATTSRTSRHLVVLLVRPHEGSHVYTEWIFERAEAQWRFRGGSGRSGAFADRRPSADERPVAWPGVTTLFPHGRWTDTLRVIAGRARSDVGRISVVLGSAGFDVDIDEHGWFYILLDGSEPATVTAYDSADEPVSDLDGLPVALRVEAPRGT